MRANCLQHVPFEGLGSVEPWLRANAARVSTTRLFERPTFPPAFPSLGDVDLLIMMGGAMSVNDDAEYSWLEPEQRFIQQAIEQEKAVLGVSLGAHCGAELVPSRFVQSESEILSSSAESFVAVNGLMANTLEYLCGVATLGQSRVDSRGSTSEERRP